MKTVSVEEAVTMIPDGASLMIGGFMGVGTPERLIDELVRQGKRNITVIANDTAVPRAGYRKARRCGPRQPHDRKSHRIEPGDAETDDRRKDGRRSRAAGHADRAHSRRRLQTWRGAYAHRGRHRRPGRQAAG